MFGNNDYKFILKEKNCSNNTVIRDIYQKIADIENIEYENLESSKGEQTATTEQVILDKDSMINVNLQEVIDETIVDQGEDDYIHGYIIANNQRVSEEVKVTLINTNTEQRYSLATNTGEYKFNKPDAGKYKIEFKFEGAEINGQNYEVEPDYKSINETENIIENSVNPENSNTNELKEKFKIIDYDKEKTLNENTSECALIAWTDEFDVNDLSSKKYASILLTEREKFKLEVDSFISAYNITLTDGQIVANWKREENDISASNVKKPLTATLDSELRYGATVNIEHIITVTNKGNIDCTGFTLVSGNDLVYDASERLLTSNKQNVDFSWDTSNVSDYIANNLEASRGKESYIKLECDSLSAGETKEFKFIVSKLLAEESKFYNVTEIVKYSNEEGRRNFNRDGTNKSLAGNYFKTNTSESKNEDDTGISDQLIIMPPFGGKNNNQYMIYLLYIFIALLICIVIYIKLKNIRSQE